VVPATSHPGSQAPEDSVSGRRAESNYHGRQLQRELRKLRVQNRLSQEEAGERAHIEHSKLSRIEQQQQLPTYHELLILLDVYGVLSCDTTPYFDLWQLAKQRGWWREYTLEDNNYLRMEDEADVKKEFQLGYLPTLLQTEKYARATLNTAVRSPQDRGQTRDPANAPAGTAPRLACVDRSQITLLLERIELPNVTFRIVPPQLVHEGLQGSVILLSFDDPAEPDMAFADTPLGMTESQNPKRVAAVTRILDQLTSLALSPDDSRALLTSRR
jgi:transcriptional regulator with XRE-family HTH domain